MKRTQLGIAQFVICHLGKRTKSSFVSVTVRRSVYRLNAAKRNEGEKNQAKYSLPTMI